MIYLALYIMIAVTTAGYFLDHGEKVWSKGGLVSILLGLLFPLSISIYLYCTIKHIGK